MAIKSAYPVGTLEELKARGWRPDEYGSCSKPDGSENIGCYRWKDCEKCGLRDHKDIAGQGPETVPYEFVKHESQGGGMRQDLAPCYAAVGIKRMIEGSQGVFRILENADGHFQESVFVSERQRVGTIKLRAWEEAHPGEKAPDYLVTGAHSPTHPDQQTFEDQIVERKVAKFARPGDNKSMVKHLLAAKVREQEIKKQQQKKIDDRLNIRPDDVKAPSGKPK